MRRSALLIGGCLALVFVGMPVSSAVTVSDPGFVAFADDRDGNSEVYLLDLTDGSEQILITHPAEDSAPQWSSFGSRLAFVSDRSGVASLYVDSLDGSDPVRISEISNLDWSWSPDGQRMAWVQHGGVKDLWITDVVTGLSTNLTNGTREVWGPSWSPDGRFLTVESRNTAGVTHVFRIAADGGPAVNLTAGFTSGRQPQWSPDGASLAFVEQPAPGSPTPSLYVMNADGTKPRRLTGYEDATNGCVPGLASVAWAPDGSRLAYAGTTSCGGRAEFYEFLVIDAAGGTPTSLGVTGQRGGPSWSPDGSRLAISAGDWNSDSVTLVDADGTDPVNLTGLVGTGQTRSVGWSDGSRLVFEADPDPDPGALPTPPNSDIYVVDADGSNPVNLRAGTGPDWRPADRRGVGLVDPDLGSWNLEGHTAFSFGVPGDRPVVGDWDCDGIETPGVFRPAAGAVYLRNSSDTGVADISFFFGAPGDVPLAGDWDGDGCDSFGVYRPTRGAVFLRDTLDTGFAEVEYFFGIPGDQPFVGNFDADDADEIGLFRPGTGMVYLKMDHSTGAADVEFPYGAAGDHFIAGDWDGDGLDTIGVFRPADHRFLLRNENRAGFADDTFWMGRSTWWPVAGSFR